MLCPGIGCALATPLHRREANAVVIKINKKISILRMVGMVATFGTK